MAQFFADRIAIGSHRARTPEGYLLCTGIPFARTGIQIYKENEVVNGGSPDKEVSVMRPYTEVFDPKTLASFEGKPITSPHPPQFITADNYAQYAKGHIQNVRQGNKLPDGEFSIVGDLLITDAGLISRIESGLVEELSAGYDTEYVRDPHSPDIYKQTKIVGNHVAVIPAGRCGPACRILDCACQTKKEETAVAETTPVVDDKVSVGALTGLLRLLGFKQPTADSESEAVERNNAANAEALKRAARRNQDAEEKMEKEEKEEKDRKAKDAEEKEKEKEKKAEDSFRKILGEVLKPVTDRLDAIEKEKKEEKDAEEAEAKKKKEEEDAELIPVATLSGEEVPKNPIPGADKAADEIISAGLTYLRSIKASVAASRDKKAMQDWNAAFSALKGGKMPTGDAYTALVKIAKPAEVETAENLFTPRASDSKKSSEDFTETAKKFHRRNAGEAVAELRTAGKE